MDDQSQQRELSKEQQFHQLDEELSIAQFSFALYQSIALDTSNIKNDDLDKASYYFRSLLFAERVIFGRILLIQLHKFFDTHPKSIHLKELVYKCNGSSSKNIKALYNSLDNSHKAQIKEIRNQLYAHTDRFQLPSDIFANINVNHTQLLKILNTLEKIMHAISENMNIERGRYINHEDVKQELKKLILNAIKIE